MQVWNFNEKAPLAQKRSATTISHRVIIVDCVALCGEIKHQRIARLLGEIAEIGYSVCENAVIEAPSQFLHVKRQSPSATCGTIRLRIRIMKRDRSCIKLLRYKLELRWCIWVTAA